MKRRSGALYVLWPSWLLFMVEPEVRSIVIPAISVAINALLDGVAGWLIWFGLLRKRALLVLAPFPVLMAPPDCRIPSGRQLL